MLDVVNFEEKKMFTKEFLADRGRHLDAKLVATMKALRREVLLEAANEYKIKTLLPQIREAQKRFKEGTYGYCVDCDEEIQEARLLMHPQVARCVDCQELEERRS